MVNLRNLQIFGWRAFHPEKRHIISAVMVLLILVAATIWILRFDEQKASTIASGAAVTPVVPLEESQQQSSTTESSAEAIPQEEVNESQETTLEQTPEEKQFYEYGGSCASDVKDAQDDVTDVTTYLNQYQQQQSTYQSEHDVLQAEYEAKLAELKQFYEAQLNDYGMKIESASRQVNDAHSDLDIAQKNLQETQVRCEPTP